jgi:hypothetical protein
MVPSTLSVFGKMFKHKKILRNLPSSHINILFNCHSKMIQLLSFTEIGETSPTRQTGTRRDILFEVFSEYYIKILAARTMGSHRPGPASTGLFVSLRSLTQHVVILTDMILR